MNQGSLVGRFVVAVGMSFIAAAGWGQSAPAPAPSAGPAEEERGVIDSFTSVSTGRVYAPARPTRVSRLGAGVTEAAGGGIVFTDDFSRYELTSFIDVPGSLFGVLHQPNPFGFGIVEGKIQFGVATDAIMMTIPQGAPGGMPPSVQPPGGEPYLALARRTGQSPRITGIPSPMIYGFTPLRAGSTPASHARVMSHWYLKDDSTQWEYSDTNPFNATSIPFTFGGVGPTFQLFHAGGNPSALDRFVFRRGGFGTDLNILLGYFATPHSPLVPFPTGEWFKLMTVLADDPNNPGNMGIGVFIKTAATMANGFMDPRMASGDIIPLDKDPAGWLNLYPGIDDIPGGAPEGIGRAMTALFNPAPNTGPLGLAPVDTSINRLQEIYVWCGGDPPADTHPNFLPQDAFIDELVFSGLSCALDLNGDGVIGGVDILILLNDWGNGPNGNGNPINNPLTDINGDGVVNGVDLLILLNSTCP